MVGLAGSCDAQRICTGRDGSLFYAVDFDEIEAGLGNASDWVDGGVGDVTAEASTGGARERPAATALAEWNFWW